MFLLPLLLDRVVTNSWKCTIIISDDGTMEVVEAVAVAE
jgi:hypothetical protein